MSDKDLIDQYLAKKTPARVKPGFAQGCEINGHERRLVRRDFNESVRAN